MARVHLTQRALIDIDRIDTYSHERWGEKVATKYLTDLHGGLKRLENSPGLLLPRHQSMRLRFYQVREHMLVCDVIRERIYVLTIIH